MAAEPPEPALGTDTASRCGPNAGVGAAPGPAVVAWHRGPSGGAGARARRPAAADAGTGRPTPSPKEQDPSLPFNPLETNVSRRPSPPVAVWGRRPPRGGHDARLIRARMALGT